MNWLYRLLRHTFLAASVAAAISAFATPQVGSVTIGTQTPNPVVLGKSATFSITVRRGTATNVFDATLQVTNALPAGITATFTTNTLHFATGNRTRSTTLTMNVPFCASPTNLTFFVRATAVGNTNDFAVTSRTLAVTRTNTVPLITISGTSPTCPQTSNLTYSATTTIPTPRFNWTITGNASLSGATTNSAVNVNTSNAGTFTLNVTVTQGAAGCSASTNRVITVGDTTPPVITQCASNQQAAATTNCQAAVPNFTTGVIASDGCGAVAITQTPTAGTLVGFGPHPVTLTVTDRSGNTNQCQATFTVVDTTPPTITCPVNVTTNASPGLCAATGVKLGTPVTSDNCGVASVTSNAPSSFPVGVTVVTWTVVDVHGNSNTCQQTVTVLDKQPPTITCPGTVTANADAGLCAATGVKLGTPVTSDNCAIASVTNNAPATFPVGNTVVTWIATDTSGNISTCSQTVTVVDNQRPIISCPATVNVNADSGKCYASNVTLTIPIASDNCGIASITNNAPAQLPVGSNTVTWTATDVHGLATNCQQLVVVIDNQPPMITAPSNITTNPAGACTISGVKLGTPVTADNCGVATVTSNAPASFPTGTTKVIWTVTDIHDNSATATQNVTVVDNTPPTITCPATVNANADSGQCFASGVNLGTPVTSDNCAVAAGTNNAPATFPVGTTLVKWTVTDLAGNSNSCTQSVIVTDNQPPSITCASHINANTGSGQCTVPLASLGTPVTSDNCGIASLTSDAPANVPVGDTIITWTVIDVHGNTNSCQQTITITDAELPVIHCPVDAVITLPPGSNSVANANFGTPTTSDNCGVATVTNDAPSTLSLGNTLVTWTVTDVHGNNATCQQHVIVQSGANPPVAVDDAFSTKINTALHVPAPGLLTNDTGAAALSALFVSNPGHGTLALNVDGSFTYTPTNNFTGTDTFFYRVSDGALLSTAATVTIDITPFGGASDASLYAKTATFAVNWAATGGDSFRIAGKLNPRGAKTNLSGATLALSINGVTVDTVPLDATGRGASAKTSVSLNSATGLYSVTVKGADLRDAIGLPNVTEAGVYELTVKLTFTGTGLEVNELTGKLETPFSTTAGKTSKGKFVFTSNVTLTGAFNWNKTSATQLKTGNFTLAGSGVIENADGLPIAPTGPVRVNVGSAQNITATLAIVDSKHTFKISAAELAGTGLPAAGAGAATSYELPISFEIPAAGGTNIFETIIELKRPTGTTTKWSR